MSIEKLSSSTTMNLSYENINNRKMENSEPVNQSVDQIIYPEKVESKENIQQVITSLNKFLEPNNTHLKFELHGELNEYYVTIVDNHTNEVVREIPSKRLLDIYAAMTEFLGFIVDKKI
ncbi:flagellar protein FlaG [Fredinandcohnia sp. 179-A 10B2 NHS]|uniref:flagellar protein FlaG n=1 Tax=Fredinandcohnia sp. 179-A 10B2 NHS TaxID=3235176 RepID=UPI00399F163D